MLIVPRFYVGMLILMFPVVFFKFLMRRQTMFSTQLTQHIGRDGILSLNVPLDIHDQNVEVLIVVQPKPRLRSEEAPKKRVLGGYSAQIRIAEDFDDTPDSVIQAFEGHS